MTTVQLQLLTWFVRSQQVQAAATPAQPGAQGWTGRMSTSTTSYLRLTVKTKSQLQGSRAEGDCMLTLKRQAHNACTWQPSVRWKQMRQTHRAMSERQDLPNVSRWPEHVPHWGDSAQERVAKFNCCCGRCVPSPWLGAKHLAL